MIIRTGVVYQSFKYAIYTLLAVNTGHFLLENIAGSAFTYEDGMNIGDIIVAYTDAIDTAVWLILLLLLELKTFVIPDEKIKGWVDWTISVVTVFCYGAILYAFYGYAATLGVPMGFEPYAGPDPCGFAGTGASFANSLLDYEPLDAQNCAALAAGAFYHPGVDMFTTPENLSLIKRQAWLDVVNAGVWVIVVTVLELEVWLKSSKLFGTKFFYAYKSAKLVLYAILIVDVFYWWRLGDPWAAWDAFLWLVAFFFIEMNVLTWQEENAEKRAAGKIA